MLTTIVADGPVTTVVEYHARFSPVEIIVFLLLVALVVYLAVKVVGFIRGVISGLRGTTGAQPGGDAQLGATEQP